MRNFFRSSRFKVFLGVFAALMLGIIVAAASENGSSPASSALGTVFSPVFRVSDYLADSVKDFSVYFRSSKTLSNEVLELESRLADSQAQLVDYEKAKQKNALYEEFLELKEERSDFKFSSASIVGSDSSGLFGSFTLNRGSLNGISVNDPVIYGKYLVGVVVSVKPTFCTVNTILNPEVNVSAYEVRTREQGFSTTTVELSQNGLCRLSGLVKTTAVAPGGIICTSGVGGIYPSDLIVGIVTEVLDDTHDISSYAVFESQVNFKELRDVFIITDFTGAGASQND